LKRTIQEHIEAARKRNENSFKRTPRALCLPPMIYNANCDLYNRGKIDGKDIATVAKHFGQADP
jgi:hypothetical protein